MVTNRYLVALITVIALAGTACGGPATATPTAAPTTAAPTPTAAHSVAPAPTTSAAPSPSVEPSSAPAPLQTSSAVPSVSSMFAYFRIPDLTTSSEPQNRLLFLANTDGTGAHELVPGFGGWQSWAAWSSDGTRLIFHGSTSEQPPAYTGFFMTDVSGTEPQRVDTGCVSPCTGDRSAAFSRDGTRLVFVRGILDPPDSRCPDLAPEEGFCDREASVLATIDLSTGRVTELPSTTILDCPLMPGQAQPGTLNCGYGANQDPRWSPDGTQIVFSQDVPYDMNGPANELVDGMPAPPNLTPSSLFVVDADGRNLRRISPASLPGRFPEWSPDGSRIVFTSYVTEKVGPAENPGSKVTQDIYTVGADGTDLRQLTSDGISSFPAWTADGRIWFERNGQLWVMGADGSNATQLYFALPPDEGWKPDRGWALRPPFEP